MLLRLVNDRPCVAVTGTCGKSTVTAMLGCILEHCGMDPTVVNGAPVLNWVTDRRVGNTRRGRPDLWVIEADESDRSLLRYTPDWAVITNASQDHFSMEETTQIFRTFAGQVRRGCVNAAADPSVLAGFAAETSADASRFVHQGVSFVVPVPGRHNAENAYLAVKAAELLGCSPSRAAAALKEFKGVHRRLERIGAAAGVTVIDDYAHNPAKIAAAWDTFARHRRRVLAVWRPHGYAPLRNMCDALAYMFAPRVSAQNRLFLLPVYDAGGTADRSVRVEMLAERMASLGAAARCVEAFDVPRIVAAEARPGDVVLVMGARDPDLPALARRVMSALRDRAQRTVNTG
jgi:UDP-N-acetylmuramate--alanine ligase